MAGHGRTGTTTVAATGLTAVGVLHAVWATGSSWPFGSGEDLADRVAGRPDRPPPGPGACLAVAGLLFTAAALVDGHPRSLPSLSRAGATGVVATLALRGGLGLAGRTDLVSPGSTSAAFRRRDRRCYAPLCLALAALSAPAVRRRTGPPAERDW
jgi:hypothetical protein